MSIIGLLKLCTLCQNQVEIGTVSHLLVIRTQDVKNVGLPVSPTFPTQYITVMFWFSVDTILVLKYTCFGVSLSIENYNFFFQLHYDLGSSVAFTFFTALSIFNYLFFLSYKNENK